MKRPRKPRPDASRSKPAPRLAPPTSTGLPDRGTLAAFVQEAGETDVGEIAKHFGLKGADRRALRQMLKDLEGDGALAKRGRRGFAEPGALPPVGVADVVTRNDDGDLYVQLVKGEDDTAPVRLAAGPDEAKAGAPGIHVHAFSPLEVAHVSWGDAASLIHGRWMGAGWPWGGSIGP